MARNVEIKARIENVALIGPKVVEIASEGPLGADAIARLFERIIDEARRLERRVVHGETDESGQVPPALKE